MSFVDIPPTTRNSASEASSNAAATGGCSSCCCSDDAVKAATACHQEITSTNQAIDAVAATSATTMRMPRKGSTVSFHPMTTSGDMVTRSTAASEDDDHDDESEKKQPAVAMHMTPDNRTSLKLFVPAATSTTAAAAVSLSSSSSYSSSSKKLASNNSSSGHSSHKQGLTLSAFRRSSVRLTRADPNRKLEDYYEMRAFKSGGGLHSTGSSSTTNSSSSGGVLGHGAFSTVRMAVRKEDHLPVAVKSIAKHEALRARRLRVSGGNKHHLEEWDILKQMRNHPFIINLMEVFETEEEIILVLEYCQGGELFNAIQRRHNRRKQATRRGQYTETQAAVITSQILKALADLHASGIVHRDVKPENILLTDEHDDSNNRIRVKLCDFGMARSLQEDEANSSSSTTGSEDGSKSGEASPITPGRSRAYSIIGSNYYAAPEIHYGNPYDTAVDIYSLGVTKYILLCGFPPCFAGQNSEEVIFPNSYWNDVSQDAKDLLKKMLHHDPLERITAREALRDKWIWQHLQNASPKQRPAVLKPRVARFASPERCSNLDLVRNQLYQNLSLQACSMKRVAEAAPILSASPPKRHCYKRQTSSAALIALADLYRDAAQSPSAKVLTANNTNAAALDASGAPKTPLPEGANNGVGCLGARTSPLRPLSV